MNDPQIRKALHKTILRDHHNEITTLVIDELGIDHGKCRADIAVINGSMIGYEIKSHLDTLNRLNNQIKRYNAVFDRSYIVLAESHLNHAMSIIPAWWGVLLVTQKNSNEIYFNTIRDSSKNENVNNYMVAQLLWREEAQEILMDLGVSGKRLREKRSNLYHYIVDLLEPDELRFIVREYLKRRVDWRHH